MPAELVATIRDRLLDCRREARTPRDVAAELLAGSSCPLDVLSAALTAALDIERALLDAVAAIENDLIEAANTPEEEADRVESIIDEVLP